jgi:hypothetical protein
MKVALYQYRTTPYTVCGTAPEHEWNQAAKSGGENDTASGHVDYLGPNYDYCGSSFVKIATLGINQTSYNHTNLQPGTYYQYQLEMENSLCAGPRSPPIEMRTHGMNASEIAAMQTTPARIDEHPVVPIDGGSSEPSLTVHFQQPEWGINPFSIYRVHVQRLPDHNASFYQHFGANHSSIVDEYRILPDGSKKLIASKGDIAYGRGRREHIDSLDYYNAWNCMSWCIDSPCEAVDFPCHDCGGCDFLQSRCNAVAGHCDVGPLGTVDGWIPDSSSSAAAGESKMAIEG